VTPHSDHHRLLLRPREAAAALGIALRTLMALVAAGEIPVVRIGTRCLRFSTAALETWIRERTVTATAPAPTKGGDGQ